MSLCLLWCLSFTSGGCPLCFFRKVNTRTKVPCELHSALLQPSSPRSGLCITLLTHKQAGSVLLVDNYQKMSC